MGGLFEYIKMAVQNIRANKGRSFLTMLGIIIGIASVIAIVSIGEGTKNQMNSEIDGIGGGQIAVSVSNDAITESEFITAEDVQAVREIATVEGVNVSESYDGETVTGKGNFSIMLTAEGPDAKLLNNSEMKYGNYFGENEIEEGKNVCVISDADAKRLFGTDDVVGMNLDITCYDSSKSFRIMGVTTQKENGTFVSYTYDGMPVTVNIPYSSMEDLVGATDEFYSLMIQGDKTLDSQIIADQVVHVLEKRHQCAGEAMIAADMAPGMNRSFLAEDWKHLVPRKCWYDALEEAQDRVNTDIQTDIQGYDIDAEALKAARSNAKMAGVDGLIHFQQRAVKDLSHQKPYGFIITNPPYGERLEEKEALPQLYREIGESYNRLDKWSMYLITSYDRAENDIGRKADKNRKIYNGMLKTYYYQFLGPKPPRRKKD